MPNSVFLWNGARCQVSSLPLYIVLEKMNALSLVQNRLLSLKQTANASENGWLEYDPFLLGRPIFRGYCVE